jgi:hypothetical protein
MYCITGDLVESLSEVFVVSLDLPMINKPINWKTDKESKGLNWGGYTINAKAGIFPGVHAKSAKTLTFVSNKNIDALNFLQSIPFVIDKKALEYLDNNFLICLDDYLNSTFDNSEEYKLIFRLNDEKTEATVISFEEAKDLNTKTKKYSDNILKKVFQKTTNLIFWFIDIFFLANALKEYEFYYPVFIDSRGRIYYSAGTGLHPQGNEIARFLLTLKTSNEESINKRYKELFKKKVEVNSNLVGLDVTCSGAQILGGLIRNEKMLFDTNLFVNKNSKQEKKLSLYTVILESLLEKLEKQNFWPNNEVKSFILKKITRDFIKGWTMRFLYSEGNFSRTTFLLDTLNVGPNNDFSILAEPEQYRIAYRISKLFLETFGKIYPEAYIFLEKIKIDFRTAKKVNPTPLYVVGNSTIEGEFKSVIDAGKKVTKQYRMYSFEEKKTIRSTYKYIATNRKLDIKALIREIIPNFIHHLDSVVLCNCFN